MVLLWDWLPKIGAKSKIPIRSGEYIHKMAPTIRQSLPPTTAVLCALLQDLSSSSSTTLTYAS